MHHALLLNDILGVCSNIDHNWIVLRETSFEIGLFPLEFLVLAIRDAHTILHVSRFRACILISPRKAEKLEMHVLNEVELSVSWLMINFFRVIVIFHGEHLEIVGVRIIVAAQEPVLFSSQPSLPKGKLSDIA